ncbi:MAG TPA: carbon storage regulator, partial [Gemmataceae bacterium]|nr:carbon storage regulator [Gemmataceae bacterium]
MELPGRPGPAGRSLSRKRRPPGVRAGTRVHEERVVAAAPRQAVMHTVGRVRDETGTAPHWGGRNCQSGVTCSAIRGVEFGRMLTTPRWKEEATMLVLSRKLGEKIYIGENICITV